MATTLRRESCPYCKSSDNVCFFLNKQGQETSKCMTEGCEYNTKKKPSKHVVVVGEYKRLEDSYGNDRGISVKTCEKLDYPTALYNNQIVHIENHRDKDGNVIRQKARFVKEKEFAWLGQGDKGRAVPWGLWACGDYTKPIIITEGPIDALSFHEIGYQAVSVIDGVGSAVSLCQDYREEFSKYNKIYVCLDNAEDGKKATEQCLEILPLGKTYTIDLDSFKDANEALQVGPNVLKEIIENNTKEYVPSGIVFGDQIDPRTLLVPEPEGLPLVFPEMQSYTKGIKPGRVYLLGAGSGVGKSTITKEIALHWMQTPAFNRTKIASIFLEERQKFTLQSYVGMYLNRPVYEFEENPDKYLGEEIILNTYESLLNKSTLAFFDHFGSLNSDKLMIRLEYLAAIKRFQVIILDHISIIVSGTQSSKEGERKDIDMLMTKLKELTVRTGVSIIVVSHLTRPQGEGFEEGRAVTLNSFRGSGSLVQLSDVVFSIERNTQSEFEKDKSIIRFLKNRITGKLGIADTIYYMENTGRMKASKSLFV